MAKPSRVLVDALRRTAERVREGAPYQWGHYGHCNCGHLAQTLTGRTPGEIHRMATSRAGEWQDQAREFCPTSGFALADVIRDMLGVGLAIEDLVALENLHDPKVLARIPDTRRWLDRNSRDDLVLYLQTWAEILAEQLPAAAPAAPAPAPAMPLSAAPA